MKEIKSLFTGSVRKLNYLNNSKKKKKKKIVYTREDETSRFWYDFCAYFCTICKLD